jgi:hypothetical protein
MTNHMPTNSRNGTAHFAWYEDGISFVWDGDPGHNVEVCPGGYGEPVEWTFPMMMAASRTPTETLAKFHEACRLWLDRGGTERTSLSERESTTESPR